MRDIYKYFVFEFDKKKNKKVQKFVDFFWAVVNEEVEKKLGIKGKSEIHGEDYKSAASIAVSARHV